MTMFEEVDGDGVNVTVRLSFGDWNKLMGRLRKRDQTVSGLVSEIIAEYLNRSEAKPPENVLYINDIDEEL